MNKSCGAETPELTYETPEEDALKKMEAKPKGLLENGLVAGKHIRLTHGYEFFLTVGPGTSSRMGILI